MRLLVLGSLAACRVIAQVDDDDEVLLRHLSHNETDASNATSGHSSASGTPAASSASGTPVATSAPGNTTDTNATAHHHVSASGGNTTAGAPSVSASASGGSGAQPVAGANATATSSTTAAPTNGTLPVTDASPARAPGSGGTSIDGVTPTDAPVTDSGVTDSIVTDSTVTDNVVTQGPNGDGGSNGDGGYGEVTRKPINSELCTADNYAAHGLAPPATMGTLDKTKHLMSDCQGYTKGGSMDTDIVVKMGANAVTEEQCTSAKGTFMKQTCGDVTGADKYGLMYCCGHSPSYIMNSVSGNTMVSGTVKIEGFTDSACATPAATIPAKEAWKVGKTHTMAECQSHPEGMHFAVSSCNGTDANSYLMMYAYYDSACTHPYGNFIEKVGCNKFEDRRRLTELTAEQQQAAVQQSADDTAAAQAAIKSGDPSGLTENQKLIYDSLKMYGDVMGEVDGTQAGSGNGTATTSPGTATLGSTKVTCEGQVATEKVFTAIVEVDFDIPADIKPAEVTAIKTVYEKESTDKFTASVAVAEAKIDAVHTYTGALNARRRLSVRRKLSTAKASASSTFSATVPAAKADQASKAVQDAATGGALKPDTFKEALETAFAADPALANVNITASPKPVDVSAPVAVPVTPAAGGGSTSSAFDSCLGAVVGALAGVMLLF